MARYGEMRYPPLLIALFLALLADPLLQRFTSFEPSSRIFLALIFLAVLFAFRHSRMLVTLASFLAIVAIVSRHVGESYHRLNFLTIGHGASFVMMVIAMVAIMGEVLRARTASTDLVAGAVCLYLILGLAWAFFYYWFSLLVPSSIFQAGIQPDSAPPMLIEMRFNEILYYSFSCLTSIGSSGEENLTRMAHQLGVVEAATGQLYLAVLVSRLVGFSTSGAASSKG